MGAPIRSAPPRSVSKPHGHPADGLTMRVAVHPDAHQTIIDPRSFNEGNSVIWRMTWGNPLPIRHAVASLLESYDYLLSDNITMAEATRRLRLMRQVRRAALSNNQPKGT